MREARAKDSLRRGRKSQGEEERGYCSLHNSYNRINRATLGSDSHLMCSRFAVRSAVRVHTSHCLPGLSSQASKDGEGSHLQRESYPSYVSVIAALMGDSSACFACLGMTALHRECEHRGYSGS